jgi:hypothetical protein
VYTVILNGAITGTGTAPPGGWTWVDTWKGTAAASTWTLMQSAGASNNVGATWNLVLMYTCATAGTSFTIFACETATPTSHTYNAATILGTPPYTPGSGTSPPYAQVAGSPNVLGTNYSQLYFTTGSIGVGTNGFLLAANRDGFFVSVLSTTTVTLAAYAGAGTTLVTNPSLTDPVPLFVCDFLQVPALGSTTREPGATTGFAYWGWYNPQPFVPNTPATTPSVLGTGHGTNGDFFLANAQTVSARWVMARNTSATASTMGAIRGVLPGWLQYIQQSACAWGDTVTEGSDTLTFVGLPATAPNLWIDTSAA